MKDSLETLRDGLLLFSVVLLVYVLYKRLLKILGKKEKSKRYPTLGESIIWHDARNASIAITLEEPSELKLAIFNTSGEVQMELLKGKYEIGTHELPMNLSSLSPGKYYLKVTSDYQEASRYFDLV
jgi:hypothetical protein